MKLNFPEKNKLYLQNNRTNVYPLGNIWSSSNLDLQSNLGVMRISPRLLIAANSNNLSNFGCPVAFRWFDSKIFAVCGTHMFRTDTGGRPDSTWEGDTSTGVQTDYSADESDMEIFNGTLCSTTTDGLFSKASDGSGTGAYTQRDTISTGAPHVMTYFKRFNRLYYSNSNDDIISIDTNWLTADPGSDYAISITNNTGSVGTEEYVITSLRATNSFIWIGTYINFDNKNMPGKICQWDGISAQITAEYKLNNAQGVLSIAIDPVYDNPYVLDTNGVLSAFNGSGFDEIARFPFPFVKLPYNVGDQDNERAVHPNGMYFTKNGTLRILFNNLPNVSTANVIENMPSGIWEWSKETGLVHIQPFTYTATGSTTITDFGQNQVSRVGALTSMNLVSTSATADGTLLAGAVIYSDATTALTVIATDNSLNTIRKKGYVVTDWLESSEMASAWDVFWMSYREFLDSTDNITVKYRVTEEAPVQATITWVDTTNFTVANSSVDISDYWTSGTGGEVEILRGTGGGSCVHISNAVLAGGTWTVTVDEAVTGVTTGTAIARFQKWIKVFPALSLASPSNWAQFAMGTDSTPRIQVKICFTYTGNGEFYKSVLTSVEDISIK